MKRGLSDSSETVVDACRFMVCAHWFRDADYDPVELLQRLDVVGVDVREAPPPRPPPDANRTTPTQQFLQDATQRY